jgi:hypothetical protein
LFPVFLRGRNTACAQQPFPAQDEGYKNAHGRDDDHHTKSTPKYKAYLAADDAGPRGGEKDFDLYS